MADNKTPVVDYEVGYGKPPKECQFKSGQSGNPKGRPKSRKLGVTDVSALLTEPVKVKAGGKACDMSPFEAGLRQLARKALNKDLRAILRFVNVCEEYKVMAPPPAVMGGGVIVAPKGVDFHEWVDSVTELVPVDEE